MSDLLECQSTAQKDLQTEVHISLTGIIDGIIDVMRYHEVS